MDEKTLKIKDDILLAALDDVPFDGWTWEGARAAANNAGHDADMADAVFPEKLDDVLRHFADWADRQMMEALEAYNPDEMRVRERVARAIELRLTALEPHKDSVQAAAGYWARPFKKITAAKLVWRTADKIWIWAGDTASDYNHYSKRALLSGVLGASTLYWLNNQDESMDSTRAFIDRRIDNVLKLGMVSGRVISKAQKFKSACAAKK